MTAATSQKNKSFFGIRFKNNISGISRLLVVQIVLSLLGLPLGCIAALYASYLDQIDSSKYLTYDPTGFIVASVISIGITLFLGLGIALHSFRYQHKKSLTDMHLSLPLNNRDRFFADYLSGLAVYVLPLIGAILITLGILAFAQSFIDDARELMQGHIKEIFLVIWIFIIALVMFYTLCVLALNFAGSKFEAVFSCIALNIMIPSVIACTSFNIIKSASFGMNTDALLTSNLMTTTSPIGNMIYFAIAMEDIDLDAYSFPLAIWTLLSLIAIFVYLLLAYILYKVRKAEDVSKPYVFKWYYYLVLVSAVYCFLSLFFLTEANIMPGIIIAAILWFILEVITRRGFKRIWVGAICFAGAIAVAFGIRAVCDSSKGFGLTKYVPSKSMVSSVTVSYHSGEGYIYDLKFKDREIIDDVVELHSNIIDRYKNPDKYSYVELGNTDSENKKQRLIFDSARVNITYALRNGSRCTREYFCTSDISAKLFTDILLSDEYAEMMGDRIYKDAERTLRHFEYDDMPVPKGAQITIEDKFGISNTTRTLNDNEIKRLSEAYTADLKNMTADDLKNSKIWGNFTGNYDNFILSSFDNTISLLLDLGYKEPVINEKAFGSDAAHDIYAAMIGLYPEPVVYAKEHDYYSESKNGSSPYFRPYYDSYGEDTNRGTRKGTMSSFHFHWYHNKSYLVSANLLEFDNDLKELLDRATYLVINEKLAGVLEINSKMYFIPDEGDNAELVERVYNSQFTGAIKTTYDYYN